MAGSCDDPRTTWRKPGSCANAVVAKSMVMERASRRSVVEENLAIVVVWSFCW